MPTYRLLCKAALMKSSVYVKDFTGIAKNFALSGMNLRGIQCMGDRPLIRGIKKNDQWFFNARYISVFFMI